MKKLLLAKKKLVEKKAGDAGEEEAVFLDVDNLDLDADQRPA